MDSGEKGVISKTHLGNGILSFEVYFLTFISQKFKIFINLKLASMLFR